MDLNSIKKIREYRDDIRIKIKSTDIKKFKDSTFGAENEYSYKGLIGGIEALLTDVTALTKAPTKFVKLSTHAERNAIVSSLNQVLSYIDNPTELTQSFESLKVQLRKYNLRYLEDRHIEFDDEIQEVRKIKLELQQVYKDSKTLFDDVDKANESLADSLKVTDSKLEEIDEELDRITKRKELLIEQSADLREVNTELTDLKELANTHLTEITESLTEVKSNEKLISTFASTVRERK